MSIHTRDSWCRNPCGFFSGEPLHSEPYYLQGLFAKNSGLNWNVFTVLMEGHRGRDQWENNGLPFPCPLRELWNSACSFLSSPLKSERSKSVLSHNNGKKLSLLAQLKRNIELRNSGTVCVHTLTTEQKVSVHFPRLRVTSGSAMHLT